MEDQNMQRAPRQNKKVLVVTAIVVLAVICGLVILKATQPKSVPAAEVKRQLIKSLQAGVGRSDGLEITFNPKSGLATIIQTDPTNAHGPSAQDVRIAYVLLVRLGNKMFANENVKSIQVTQKLKSEIENPDNRYLPKDAQTKSQSVVTEVVAIAMTKANFTSVNWQQYNGQPINKLITEKAYTYDINPQLKPLLKDSELYLDLR